MDNIYLLDGHHGDNDDDDDYDYGIGKLNDESQSE